MNRLSASGLVAGFLALAFAAGTSAEDARIYGTVRATSGVLSGATIVVSPTPDCKCSSCPDPAACRCCPQSRSISTDSEGAFEVSIPPGDYRVTASAPGYGSRTVTVHIEKGDFTRLDFILSSDTPVE